MLSKTMDLQLNLLILRDLRKCSWGLLHELQTQLVYCSFSVVISSLIPMTFTVLVRDPRKMAQEEAGGVYDSLPDDH